jgi:hypothetical protein
MNKFLVSFVAVVSLLMISGCGKNSQSNFSIDEVNDLADILVRTSEVTQEYER